MNGTMLIIPPEPGIADVQFFDGRPAKLADLKAGIGGGHIESVPYFDKIEENGKWRACWAICDEEGKLKGLPVNVRATKSWLKSLKQHGETLELDDVLVGTVCVLYGDDEFMASL